MPLIYVQRYVVTQAFKEGGTQFVDGALRFSGPTTITLSNDVFGQTGDYILFEYGSFNITGTGFATGQDVLTNWILPNIDDTALLLSYAYALTDDTVNKRIILSLRSLADNGTQFVDGTLDIVDGTSVYLNDTLYATAGTYVLFDVPSGNFGSTTFSGGSPNYLTGLNVFSLKGLTVVGNRAFKDGNQIKVTLA